MIGGITIGFVDVAFFLSQSDRVRCLRLGRFWCETGAITLARADESGLTSIGLYRRTLFRMVIERIDLALSRLKQGWPRAPECQGTSTARTAGDARREQHGGWAPDLVSDAY
jgi:hypothetical protein